MLLPFFFTNENIKNSHIRFTIRLNKIQNLITKKISKTTMRLLLPVVVKQALTARSSLSLCQTHTISITFLQFHHMKRRRHLKYLVIHRHNSCLDRRLRPPGPIRCPLFLNR
ncbi:unnamed protein product [Brassica napus]|uniref:(rape) hypothetical protein n=1 Tax=Brassica napus TaxID=3708 RepID=A0A816I7X8_BRANA|nr:unnamed protein product [Brassica napus]